MSTNPWSRILKNVYESGVKIVQASSEFLVNIATDSSKVFRASQSILTKAGAGKCTDHVVADLAMVKTAAGTTGGIGSAIASEGTFMLDATGATIDYAVCYNANINHNYGTITNLYGFYFPDLSAITGVTTKYSFMGVDAGAAMYNKGDIVTSGNFNCSPTAGAGIYMKSPDGTVYTVTVANGGTLTVT